MASTKPTRSSAPNIPRSPTTSKVALGSLKSANSAIVHKLQALQDVCAGDTIILDEVGDEVQHVTLLARGGYNTVWLVKFHEAFEVGDVQMGGESSTQKSLVDRYILRLPCEDALLPNQITNEVAFRRFISTRLPHITVPRVYFYHATAQPEGSFIAEEYIDGSPLSSVWMTLAPCQKRNMASTLATITVDLAEVRFTHIGGLDPSDLSPAPTVEGSKLFKGRGKFHSNEHYPVGPYASTKEYILACYQKEICYYTRASGDDIDQDLFADVSVPDFVAQLQRKRDALAASGIADERFTLVHGDLHGRNVLVKGDRLLAVLDWEFAGSYPLSETLSGGGIDVVNADSEELDEENTTWNRESRGLIHQEAARRGWGEDRIALLMGDGDFELGRARGEMFP